ncbi:MAG: protein-glutamate O-methyltransferase CheR, partial [Hyphomonadaceae bacterium]|nr:protein-glutamate O-methyltransferase CheR [Hyphomonadaceae bacterium]
AVLSREIAGPAEIRLTPLARREGFATVTELISAARIRPDGALWQSITEALAQSDTRFFRDKPNFEKLRTNLLPAAIKRRGHERVRILCAGCSTGQEPYSIAMIVEAMRDEGVTAAVEIIGADFSEKLLDKARSGLYTQFEIQRGLPIRKLIAHFEKAGDLWRISDRLRAAVKFENHNLMKHPSGLGQFDIIMLSHVLNAFAPETRTEIVNRLTDALAPEGAILLGAGESLPEACDGLVAVDGIIRRGQRPRVAAVA